jgi:quinol monooxygenase YgiN
MSSSIQHNGKSLRAAAAVLMAVLVSACAQPTPGKTVMSGSGTSNISTANAVPLSSSRNVQGMMVRISEIQIDSSRLDEYKAILKEEAEASVRLEPGVICIFPMYQRENPTEVRILEIYASREAYESHLKTLHFERYKTTTLPMVKSLKLVDMEAMDSATMPAMFGKMRRDR